MRRIVFIADDLGADTAVNDAIFHAHRHGRLDGAALMPGQPGTSAAAARAHEHPQLAIGWHVHLADSRPCTLRRWPWGDSPAAAGLALGASARMRRLARRELRAQWEAFCETGLSCRFVNAHHHLHVHPVVRRMLEDILPETFDGWVRWGAPRFFRPGAAAPLYHALYRVVQAPQRWPFPTSTTLWGLDRTNSMSAAEIDTVLGRLGDGLHEFMFHPRSIDGDADTRCLLAFGARAADGDALGPRVGPQNRRANG